ncbi:hypothetical protein DN730_05345 [Marinomonas piezotolerans]|uniref:Uncharacterized protein n=1 Tax=Marinomonas piezotolerans TaxID=2213058 RepID=A0A370UB68_9GAMM|nr:hypothetical protein [Marinomonas piezotolerans]RDL45043.1 hypothetical protein DN730_05345 [Marinomonas piezotolerans]
MRVFLNNRACQRGSKGGFFVIHDCIDYRLSYSSSISNNIDLDTSLHAFDSRALYKGKVEAKERSKTMRKRIELHGGWLSEALGGLWLTD